VTGSTPSPFSLPDDGAESLRRDEGAGVPRVPLQVTQNCLVASIQLDLDDSVLQRFQDDLLSATRARTVLLDLGGLDVLDAEEFAALRRLAEMAKWMGARPIFVGLRAGVASSLVDLGVDLTDLEAASSLDRGLELAATSPPVDEQRSANHGQ
jgi:rsbT antagonist protein RsbS